MRTNARCVATWLGICRGILWVSIVTSKRRPSAGEGGAGSWEERIAVTMDESTAIACIRGIQSEERARKVLGIVNREGVGDGRKSRVVERIGEL